MKAFFRVFALVLLVAVFFQGTDGAAFEGKIYFRYIKPGSKKIYVYYVKGNDVRIDEIGGGKVTGSTLIDIETNEMKLLMTRNKMYMHKDYSATPYPKNANISVENTGVKKDIQGYQCEEYLLKNSEKNIEISYWITQKNFDFFIPFMKTINRKEDISTHYFQIDGLTRDFPILGVQRDENGYETSRLQVTKIFEEEVSDRMFQVPGDYTEQK